MIGVEGAAAVRQDQLVIDQRTQVVVRQQADLGHFVRRAEAVEEVQERQPRCQSGRLSNRCQIVRLLHRARGQHGKSGGARRHHIRVVAEDAQRLGGHCPRCHVEDRAAQLAGDLVHVGDHQQQALRRRERGRQRADLQRAVQSPCSPRLALHLHHLGDGAPDVGPALGGPLIRELRHGRGGRDRVDGAHFVEPVRDGRGRLVAVDGRDCRH
jgi:hypothetical protein